MEGLTIDYAKIIFELGKLMADEMTCKRVPITTKTLDTIPDLLSSMGVKMVVIGEPTKIDDEVNTLKDKCVEQQRLIDELEDRLCCLLKQHFSEYDLIVKDCGIDDQRDYYERVTWKNGHMSDSEFHEKLLEKLKENRDVPADTKWSYEIDNDNEDDEVCNDVDTLKMKIFEQQRKVEVLERLVDNETEMSDNESDDDSSCGSDW